MSRNVRIALIAVALIAAAVIAYGYQSRHDELIDAEATQDG